MILPYRVALIALWLTGRRLKFYSAEAMMKAVTKARKTDNPNPPASLSERVKITERSIQGFRCMTVSPLGGPKTKTRALYIHGGSYVSEILPAHWEFVTKIVEKTGCSVEVPVYGLAPEHNYKTAYALMRQIWTEMSMGVRGDDLVLIGDSAGAGMALGFAQFLLGSGLPMTRDIALISPWLDLTLSHPDIPTVQKLDPWLSTPGLRESGRRWSGGDELNRFELSPIHGPLKGLGRVLVFAGSREIMLPDCQKLCERARSEGITCELVLGEGMVHVWPLLPIREAEGPIDRIARVILKGKEKII
jgi:acetyl esterase/lipase